MPEEELLVVKSKRRLGPPSIVKLSTPVSRNTNRLKMPVLGLVAIVMGLVTELCTVRVTLYEPMPG
jgi:hypothetical protein